MSRPSDLSISKTRLALTGARDSLPLILAAIPFAVVFGVLAHSIGLSNWATLGMSAFVFAGSAQFIAVGLIASTTALPVILLTVFVVNLRHLLYSASLMPQVKQLPQRWRIPMAFSLTDETYATVTNRLNRNSNHVNIHWYYFGSALFMYSNWVLCTFIGLTMGQKIPGIAHWGLDVAMIIGFIGIVVPMLKTRVEWSCAAVAFVAAIYTYDWPYQSGLLASAFFAIMTGLVFDKTPTREDLA